MTKIFLVALDKSHVILIANDKKILDERKNQQIQVHYLNPLYTYCRKQLKCSYFGYN